MYIIGHRGCSKNTLDSFARAIDAKCDMIELDANICQSGEIVVSHDVYIQELNRYIEDITYDELIEIGINTLQIVIDFILSLNKNARIIIEIKNSIKCSRELLRRMHQLLIRNIENYSVENFIIKSFNHMYIEKLNMWLLEDDIQIKSGLLTAGLCKDIVDCAIGAKCKFVSMSKEFINPEIFKLIHDNDMEAYVYTVNTEYEMRTIKKMGADGIITDMSDKMDLDFLRD